MSIQNMSLHLSFVSNHNGSHPADILFATLPVSLTVPLNSLILPFLIPLQYSSVKYFSRISFHLLVEITTIIIPSLFSFTILSTNTLSTFMFMLTLTLTSMLLLPSFWKHGVRSVAWSKLLHYPMSDEKPSFLTNYRAGMNLATAICILAVDFKVFPRRFAKTETFGYGLMDVGVGSFVVANGLASSNQKKNRNVWSKILPIFVLGFLRLLSVKSIDYHEHVTEYGTHWNFFFTLAVIKTFSALFKTKIRPVFLAGIIIIIYEMILKIGLESWILSDSQRNNFLSSNREGIFSLFGYLGIYYASMELGSIIKKPKSIFQDWIPLLILLSTWSILGWTSLSVIGLPSRRLANMSFCIWMLTFNTTVITFNLALDLLVTMVDFRRKRFSVDEMPSVVPITRESYLMRFINSNGLSFFLIANLLTGAVNLSFDTIHMSIFKSMIVLLCYCFILSGSVTYLSTRVFGEC